MYFAPVGEWNSPGYVKHSREETSSFPLPHVHSLPSPKPLRRHSLATLESKFCHGYMNTRNALVFLSLKWMQSTFQCLMVLPSGYSSIYNQLDCDIWSLGGRGYELKRVRIIFSRRSYQGNMLLI